MGDDQASSLSYPSDFAPYKSKADLLLQGACHVPGGKAAPACRVRFQVGRLGQSLLVFGDRYWRRSMGQTLQSEPVPFTRLGLCYENGFGGPEVPANPVGKGTRELTLPNGRVTRPLPNIEHPDARVTTPDSRPAPAGFGPIAMTWSQRDVNKGTYDDNWLKHRWPSFPEQFDWSFFNSAPQAMQAEGFLRGDEELLFENLHPEHPVYRSKLPGLRARCFLNERSGESADDQQFREVPLALDTLWVDMGTETLILVWRGLTEVRTVKMREIEHVFLMTEPLEQRNGKIHEYDKLMHHLIGMQARKFEESMEIEAFDEDLAIATEDVDQAFEQTEKEIEEFEKNLAEDDNAFMQGLVKAGVDLNSFDLSGDGTDGRLPSPAQIAAIRASHPDLAQTIEEGLAETAETDKEIVELEAEFAAVEKEFQGEHEIPMDREAVIAAAAKSESLQFRDLSGLDLSGLSLSGMNFARSDLRQADLSDSDLSYADLTGSDLSKANLTNTNLIGVTLNDAMLSGATVPSPCFKSASIDGTDFSKLDLLRADFSYCKGSYADFSGAILSQTTFVEAQLPFADFGGCLLEEANFTKAILRDADISRVRAQGLKAEGADLTGLRASDGADFTGADFRNAKGEGSIWEACILDKANLQQASFAGATLAEASLKGAYFDRAVLSGANFEDANLYQAILTNANLLESSFERADLTSTDFAGANLYNSGFAQATLRRTNIRSANIRSTRLVLSDG